MGQLRPVRFAWNGEYNVGTASSLGFLAQEVETILPELVITDTAGYKNLDYAKLTAILTNGVQTLDQRTSVLGTTGQGDLTITGNVGVGTTAPTSRLTVNTTSPSANALLFNVQNTGANVFSVDAEGDFFYDGTGSSPSADVAEIYPTSETGIVSGEIVSLSVGDPVSQTVIRSGMASDPNLLGVVTTKPALLLGSNIESGVAVALIGRVPVTVNDQNGVIAKGDYITSSSIAGEGMKATQAGMVVGRALENQTCQETNNQETNNGDQGTNNQETNQTCTVSIFTNLSWFDPSHTSLALSVTPIDTSNITDLTLQTLSVLSDSTFVNATVTGNLNVGLLSIADSSLNVAGGVLKLQDAYGSGNIEAFGGKIVMTTDGSLQVLGAITADSIEVKTATIHKGITVYDEVTGEPTCVTVREGVVTVVAGVCGM